MNFLLLAEAAAGNVWENVLVTLLVAIITSVSGYLVAFLKKKAAQNKDDALIGAALDMITDLVDATSQSVVKGLKKEGGFTAEKGQEIKDGVVNTLKERLSGDMIASIQKKYNLDIDDYLRDKVEAVLANQKKK